MCSNSIEEQQLSKGKKSVSSHHTQTAGEEHNFKISFCFSFTKNSADISNQRFSFSDPAHWNRFNSIACYGALIFCNFKLKKKKALTGSLLHTFSEKIKMKK